MRHNHQASISFAFCSQYLINSGRMTKSHIEIIDMDFFVLYDALPVHSRSALYCAVVSYWASFTIPFRIVYNHPSANESADTDIQCR